MTQQQNLILVYEALGEPFFENDEWKLKCRVKYGSSALEFDTHTFSLDTRESMDEFKNHVDNIKEHVVSEMQDLAQQLFIMQSMIENEDYFITLVPEDFDLEDESLAAGPTPNQSVH